MALPSAPPLQVTLVPDVEAVRTGGSVMITLEIALQEFASVTVTV